MTDTSSAKVTPNMNNQNQESTNQDSHINQNQQTYEEDIGIKTVRVFAAISGWISLALGIMLTFKRRPEPTYIPGIGEISERAFNPHYLAAGVTCTVIFWSLWAIIRLLSDIHYSRSR